MKDKDGCTPLHLHLQSVHEETSRWTTEETIRLILEHGGDPSMARNDSKSSLVVAVEKNLVHLIAMLRDARNPNAGRPYEFCIRDLELSSQLYEQDLQVQAAQKLKQEKHEMARTRQYQMTEILMRLAEKTLYPSNQEHSPATNSRMPFSAITYAASKDDTGGLYLLTNQSNVNQVDEKGWTPLHHAASMSRSNSTWILLCSGANPLLKDKLGRMPTELVPGNAQDSLRTIEALEAAMKIGNNTDPYYWTDFEGRIAPRMVWRAEEHGFLRMVLPKYWHHRNFLTEKDVAERLNKEAEEEYASMQKV